jgi:acyl-CoA thioesterase FadM
VYLNVQYKKPLLTPQVVIVRGRVEKIDGRKLYVKGRFEDKDGAAFSEADGMWVMIEKHSERSDISVKL